MWLLVSRLLFLTAGSLLVNFVVIYLGRAFGMSKEAANEMYVTILLVVVAANVIAIIPASRLSDRVGRKPLIFAACADRRRRDRADRAGAVDPDRAGRRGPVRRGERDVPRGRLGADDRHHPEGVGRPVHGPVATWRRGRQRRCRSRSGGIVLDAVTGRADSRPSRGSCSCSARGPSRWPRSRCGRSSSRLAGRQQICRRRSGSGGLTVASPPATGPSGRGRRCRGLGEPVAPPAVLEADGAPDGDAEPRQARVAVPRGPCGTRRSSDGPGRWNAAASRHDRGRRNANGSRCRHHHGTADQTKTR